MIGPKCVDYQSAAVIGQRGGTYVLGPASSWTAPRLPRATATHALSEITWTSEQSAEEGGQKKEGEEKKIEKSDWSREREGGSERCSLAWTLCEAAVDGKRSLTHGDADWATRLLLATLWKASCTQKAGNIAHSRPPCSLNALIS